MTIRIDLNSDVGEIPALIADGSEARLLDRITSANIACGGHAGDDDTMRATLEAARARGLGLGAHPGYEDQEHFGRRTLPLPPGEVTALVRRQVERLAVLALEAGAVLSHVNPHGALYNAAAHDRDLARAIAAGVVAVTLTAAVPRPLVLVGLAGSPCLEVYAQEGLPVAAEAFADRRYEPDGTLRSRALEGALLADPEEAAAQAVSIARDRRAVAWGGRAIAVEARTLCLHGDTPGAVAIAAAVRAGLVAAGIALAPLVPLTSDSQP
jgi:UPF0271 protein